MNSSSRFQDAQELADWLQTKPHAWSQAISSRSVLRILPLVVDAFHDQESSVGDRLALVLNSFRSCFIAWTAEKYVAADMVRAATCAASDTYACASSQSTATISAFVDDVEISARSHASSGSIANLVAYAASYAVAEVAKSPYYGEAFAGAVAHSASAARHAAKAGDQFWSAVALDAGWLETRPTARLIGQPLWLENVRESNRYKANIPPWIRTDLDALAANGLTIQHGFEPWIAWYRALIPNYINGPPHDYFGEPLSLKIASQPDEWWERPASEINTDIKAWLEERDSGPDVDRELSAALEGLPEQTPAAYRFHWQDDRLKADPPDPSPSDSAVTQDLLEEARRKAADLLERLKRANTDRYVQHSVAGLLEVLPVAVGDLRPGLLLSRARSIEAIAGAYASPEDDRELFPDAIAQILDLSETTRDLQGCLPEVRKIELERMALKIDPDDVEAIDESIRTIVDAAIADEEVVDESAKDALHNMAKDAAGDAPPEVKQLQAADRFLVVLNFLSLLLRKATEWCMSNSAAGYAREIWEEEGRTAVKREAGKALGATSAALVVLPGAWLVATLLDPIIALAVLGYGFKVHAQLAEGLKKRLLKNKAAEDDEEAERKNASRHDGPPKS